MSTFTIQHEREEDGRWLAEVPELFRRWFFEFDHLLWDRQIEADSKAGELDQLAAEARADDKAGNATEI